jgi:hypothetical protein
MTYNNYSDQEVSNLKAFFEDRCRFAIIGFEKAPTTGMFHLQCYFRMDTATKQRWKRMLELLNEILTHGVYLAVAKASEHRNTIYCRKEGNFWEYGQCERTFDPALLSFIRDNHGNKKKISDVYAEAMLRNSRGISAFMDWNQVVPKRSFKTKVHVFIGPPGCGKTRKVYDQAQLQGKSLFSKAPGPWLDGYDNDKQVLIDDYTGSCMKPDI